MNFIYQTMRTFYKIVAHFITSESELERITKDFSVRNQKLKVVQNFRYSLKLSKTLKDVKKFMIEDLEDFSVQNVVRTVKTTKNFENSGLYYAISSLRSVNVGISYLIQRANIPFSVEYEPELQRLWDELKPDETIKGRLRHSKSWSDIGFQGVDPATDFRGGGVLSLENLVYFAKNCPRLARRILNEDCRDITQGGFPFAITGINITSFLLTLAKERKLDDLFLLREANTATPRVTNIQMDESTPLLTSLIDNDQLENHQEDDARVQRLCSERFNMAYCVLFSLFAIRWRQAAPPNILEFPNVWNRFQKEIRAKVTTEEGIDALTNIDSL